MLVRLAYLYRVCQEESAIVRENVPWLKCVCMAASAVVWLAVRETTKTGRNRNKGAHFSI
jgi:hypothetical protein